MDVFKSKTNTGATLLAIGVAVYNTIDLCPISAWIPWIKYGGALLCALGGGLGMIGLGGKVDKATAAVTAVKTSAQEQSNSAARELVEAPKPLTEESFRRLLAEAKKRGPS